ncbi:SH3 domain-containing protein [Streptomyces sp. NPDC085932]|uniref:SH3 domain-containing protein n=1 Tax=Streptomyces sp. NPDC085932 TaxID=3365741 RepID=UPI0037D94F5A
MLISAKRGAMVSGAAVLAVIGGSLIAANPALAADAAAPAKPYGTVISPVGVKERALPTTNSAELGVLPHNAQVGLQCKVHGQSIDGNDLWYKLRNKVKDKDAWVSARYVKNTGDVKLCSGSDAPMLSAAQQQPVHQSDDGPGPVG